MFLQNVIKIRPSNAYEKKTVINDIRYFKSLLEQLVGNPQLYFQVLMIKRKICIGVLQKTT